MGYDLLRTWHSMLKLSAQYSDVYDLLIMTDGEGGPYSGRYEIPSSLAGRSQIERAFDEFGT